MPKSRKKPPTELTLTTGRVLVGSCLDRLKELDDASIDSIVTDPPYELGFMGKAWDASGIAYNVDLWRECLRVLKPGGHLLAFGGTRTYHRMAVAIEDAGFEVRDSIHWLYGSGFPKSLNVGKALEAQEKTGSSSPSGQRKAAMGDRYEPTPLAGTPGYGTTGNFSNKDTGSQPLDITTDAAKTWAGWGTALKPAHEPIVVARKPLAGTVAANVLEHGTGALNIDGCRVGSDTARGVRYGGKAPGGSHGENLTGGPRTEPWDVPAGRWPANIVFTHADGCQQTGTRSDAFNVVDGFRDYPQDSNFGPRAQVTQKPQSVEVPVWACVPGCPVAELDQQSDGASRFFTVTEWSELDAPFRYVAKPGKKERDAGLDKLDEQEVVQFQTGNGASGKPSSLSEGRDTKRRNTHPTVKPVALMRWLVRLVTPAGGTVLDPFLGSGTTAIAAIAEGVTWVGCEMTADYLPIIEGRVKHAEATKDAEQPTLFGAED